MGQPVPDGTPVTFATTAGSLSGSNPAATINSMASITLSLNTADDDPALVTATTGLVTATTTVNLLQPAISLSASPGDTTIIQGQTVTYTYLISNTGETPLVEIDLVDDSGTPTDNSDDARCQLDSLAVNQAADCPAVTAAPLLTTTRVITVSALTDSGNPASDYRIMNGLAVTVNVLPPTANPLESIYLPLVIR